MALVVCPDCQAEVSDQAPACPKCARPMRPEPVTTVRGSGGNVVAAVASLIIPGAGQLAQGRILNGIGGLLMTPLAWFGGLVFAVENPLWGLAGPGYHILMALDAARYDPRAWEDWKRRLRGNSAWFGPPPPTCAGCGKPLGWLDEGCNACGKLV